MATNRGFSLIEAVVALAIAALVVGIPLTVMSAQGHGFARDEARSMHASRIDLLLAQLEMSAHSAVAIYTPTGCGTTGTGDGASCSSLRFYGVDSSGNPHFWGWEYNANASSVTQCLSYGSNSEGTCIETGGTIPVSSFTATPTLISIIAPHYGGTAADVEKQVLSSDTRVIAGNRVMVVNVADAWVTRTKHLLQEGAPFSAAVLKGAFTPPTVGTLGFSGSGGPFWFWGAGDTTPQTVTVSEQNYGQYVPYLAPAWAVGTPSPTCVSVTPSTPSGDAETFSVRAAAVGSCAFTADSHDQQSATIQSYVAGPLTPIVNGQAQSGTPVVTLSWIGTGWSNTTIGAGKTYDNNENNNLASIGISVCANLSISSNGVSAPGSDSAAYGQRNWTVTATAAGTCLVTLSDSYTNETPAQVRVIVAASPTPVPTLTPTATPTLAPTPTPTPTATTSPALAWTITAGSCGLVINQGTHTATDTCRGSFRMTVNATCWVGAGIRDTTTGSESDIEGATPIAPGSGSYPSYPVPTNQAAVNSYLRAAAADIITSNEDPGSGALSYTISTDTTGCPL